MKLIINVVISVLIGSFMLASIAYWNSISEKYKKPSSILLFSIMCLHIFMLVYNSLIHSNFWFNVIWGIPEIQIIALMTILFSCFTALLFWAGSLPVDKKNYFNNKLRSIIRPIILIINSIWAYIPIIAGIITPMIIMFPLTYISWKIFYLWSGRGSFGWWFDAWFLISPSNAFYILLLLIIEITIFIVGFILFISGLLHLTKGNKNKINIVQTGPYKLVRHPQNLGILIMVFPFTLYIPGFNDLGIRIGDLLSWTLFSLIMINYSDLEEIRLRKKFPEEFKNFRANTGFFIPKLYHKRRKQAQYKKKFYLKRYFFLILSYYLLILMIKFLAVTLIREGILVAFF